VTKRYRQIICSNNRLYLAIAATWPNNNNKYVSGTDIYRHMPILCPHATLFHELRFSSMTFTSAHLYANVYMRVGMACGARALAN